jgi:prevent-host-death family protein
LTVLVHEVERGKKIELMRRGKRVAVLMSWDEYDRLRATRPSPEQALQAWRAQLPADFEGFSDDEVRSWRDPSPGREVRLR